MSKVAGLEDLDHWDRMKKGMVHDTVLLQSFDVKFTESDRRGRMAVLKPFVSTAPAVVKRAREAKLGVKGCNLFNLLPGSLRNMKAASLDMRGLDIYNFFSSSFYVNTHKFKNKQ